MREITLATLGQVSAQEVFDHVVEHLRKQGQKSTRQPLLGSYTCCYRAPNSEAKCAAGCLIADGEYNPLFEGKYWPELVDRKLVPTVHKDLIESLQNVHDLDTVDSWEVGFRCTAKFFNLAYTAPKAKE